MMQNDIRRNALIVDDELINREMLGYIVSEDYSVMYAENGKQALDILKNGDKISLVLLDLIMPEMDGFELLDIIHNDDELKRIPVIVLTSEKTAEVKSLQHGAADFIPKPYDMPDVIRARVMRSIELAEDNNIIRATEFDTLTGLYTREIFIEYAREFDEFNPDIPLFEENGCIKRIDSFVWNKVAEQIKNGRENIHEQYLFQ